VHLAGRDITGHPPHRVGAAGMARTFQLMRPFGSMSVLDNVAVAAMAGGTARRSARAAAADVVDRVGLSRWRDSRSAGLPTAALKRLELARALATRPRVLLLDEVLAGLVPAERAPVLDLLESLRTEDGITLVFVEHIMAAVMRLSDTVLVLDRGRVLATGTPDEVTRDPRVVEAYLGEGPTGAGA
jgi:branched-chain amino acid transport system ATP-binding protein